MTPKGFCFYEGSRFKSKKQQRNNNFSVLLSAVLLSLYLSGAGATTSMYQSRYQGSKQRLSRLQSQITRRRCSRDVVRHHAVPSHKISAAIRYYILHVACTTYQHFQPYYTLPFQQPYLAIFRLVIIVIFNVLHCL